VKVAGSERGVALLLALMATLMLAVLGTGLVISTMAESTIAAGFRRSHETFYGAEAALEWAIRELDRRPDWTAVLADPRPSHFAPRHGGGPPLSLAALQAEVQRTSNAAHAAGPDRPVWRLLAHGWLDGLTGVETPPLQVVVWVADDPADGDRAPLQDTNGVVMLHAEAHGLRDARCVIEAIVSRRSATPGGEEEEEGEEGAAPGGPIRLLEWREIRFGG
jgi:hypothetical protein